MVARAHRALRGLMNGALISVTSRELMLMAVADQGLNRLEVDVRDREFAGEPGPYSIQE